MEVDRPQMRNTAIDDMRDEMPSMWVTGYRSERAPRAIWPITEEALRTDRVRELRMLERPRVEAYAMGVVRFVSFRITFNLRIWFVAD